MGGQRSHSPQFVYGQEAMMNGVRLTKPNWKVSIFAIPGNASHQDGLYGSAHANSRMRPLPRTLKHVKPLDTGHYIDEVRKRGLKPTT
eukprot:385418-Amphidinium_carterae.1